MKVPQIYLVLLVHPNIVFLYLPCCGSNRIQRSIRYTNRGVKIWNKIPGKLENQTFLNSKTSINNYFWTHINQIIGKNNEIRSVTLC